MNIVDLQIRIARKMASGRGSMQLTQTDLDILVQCGAYGALCEAATEVLKEHRLHRSKPIEVYGPAVQPQPTNLRSFEVPDNVAAAVARAKLSQKHPTGFRAAAPILPALIKSSDRR